MAGKLIAHQEVSIPDLPADKERLLILKPLQLKQISYPTEWCFNALKAAALLHLDLMLQAIDHGLILKDATPYNVQFVDGAPVLIDSLSFDLYNENLPWIAYRQFCESFLYPLLLEHFGKFFVHQSFGFAKEGIDAKHTAQLLPWRSKYRLNCWLHVYLPARISGNHDRNSQAPHFSKLKMQQLISNLTGFVRSLRSATTSAAKWDVYYSTSILGEGYLDLKTQIITSLLDHPVFSNLASQTVLDIGANNGHFSKILAARARHVTAIDNDAPSINHLYNEISQDKLPVLPLVVDIADPTPASGFDNQAYASFNNRIKADVIVALAVVHHLAISRNIPLNLLADFLSIQCNTLVIEFVPKEDSKVVGLLANRPDTFHNYHQQYFEEVFATCFTLVERKEVAGTKRVIYLYTSNRSLA